MVQVSVTNKLFVEGFYANIIFVVFIIISSRSSDGSGGGSKLDQDSVLTIGVLLTS